MVATRAVFKICGAEFELLPSDDPEEVIIIFDNQVDEELTKDVREVILVVESRNLYAHKDVLISRIPYFDTLFNSGMFESCSEVVTFAQMNFDTVNCLVNAAYTGQITITDETMLDVMITAHYLQMDSLIYACAKFVEENPRSTLIRLSHALPLFIFCRDFGYRKLDRALLTFMDINFISLSHTSEFSEMSVDYLIDYVGRDSLYVDNEMQVFEAISRWMKAGESRKEHAARLLQCVRFHRIPEKLISEVVEKTNWVGNNRRCMELVNEAQQINRSNELVRKTTFKNYERFSRALSFVIGNLIGKISHITIYDPISDKWKAGRIYPSNRENFEIAAVGEKIYLIGGHDGNSYRTYDVIDTQNNSWEKKYNYMGRDRPSPIVGVINGKIYVAGGFYNVKSAATLEMLDTTAKSPVWVMVASMSKSRSSPGFCVAAGKFYVIGGWNRGILADGECYDPKTNSWSLIASMNKKRDRFGTAVIKGQIYVVGGTDGVTSLDDLNRYDPATNTWTTLKGMNRKRISAAVAVSCGKLFVFGGYDSISHSTMEVYDPETDCWHESKMPGQRGIVSVASLPIPASLQSPSV